MVYESLYSSLRPERVGPSSPVCWFINQNEYRTVVIHQDVNGRYYTTWEARPNARLDTLLVMQPGQYCDYLPACISA
jgi:hypothetical protein